MKTKYLMMVGLMVGALLMSPLSGFAKGDGDHGGLEGKFFHKAHFILEHEEELGLTKEQVDAIRTLKLNTKKGWIQKSAEIEVFGLDIQAKLYETPINTEAIYQLIDQKYEVKKANAKALVDAFATLKKTLSEAQWAQMKDLKKEKD